MFGGGITSMTDMNVINDMDVFLKVDDVSDILGIASTTVKKYYTLFEKEGYRLKRSNQGHVLFSEFDIDLLKELIDIKNQSGMKLEKAVKQLIVEHDLVSDTTDISAMTTDMSVMAKQVTTLMSDMSDMKELIKAQNEQLKQQHEYIKTSLEQRDRALMASLKESMESQKMIAASVQEELEKVKEKKWWKWW